MLSPDKNRVRFFRTENIKGLELLTCSDVTYCFPPHFHDAYCIWLNTDSAEKYHYKGSSHLLQPGNFGIIAPGEVHSNSTFQAESRHLLTFYLTSEELQNISYQINENTYDTAFLTNAYKDGKAISKLINLQHAIRKEKTSLYTDSAFIEAVSHLLINFGTKKYKNLPVSGEQRRIKRVLDIFNSKLSDDIKLDFIAKELRCTPYHLIRVFRKATGLSPHSYLIQLRLERAKQMIKSGKSIIDTAIETGFADQSHLTRKFKSKFGITPGTYKKQIS